MTLVDLTVILAFDLTVTLTLVRVNVGVLPILLLITVIPWLFRRSPPILLVPLLGNILSKIWLTFIRPVTVRVACPPLLATTVTLTFTLWSPPTVAVSSVPIALVMVTTLVNLLLTVTHTGAPFRLVSAREALVNELSLTVRPSTNPLPFNRSLPLLTAIVTLKLGNVPKVDGPKKDSRPLLVLWMTVLLSGRLDFPLVDVVNSNSLPGLSFLWIRILAIPGPFLATAFAPLKTTARTPRAILRVALSPTSILPLVFPLAFITTVAGAVKFNV